ncbi:MAG: peptidyl-tRNA hydrolase Pth2 [Nanoarchaeota archaeon]|nr:peptidyl-tRNA hydrolase Pth2 [Nanoarchaeota archaeon]MCG2717348.1 peptidyl-tRNA hydrolase Pth2 [Nanoarchaeota archaeon]
MKQLIVVRKDLKMPVGKLAAQVAHASVDAVLNSSKSNIESWKKAGSKKVVVYVNSKEELFVLQRKAKTLKLVTAVIRDAGRTFFKIPTVTCLGIGPDSDEKIDKVTGNLKML